MICPNKDSYILRCDFQAHPWKKNIEYCRTCGEWRDLEQIGRSIDAVGASRGLLATLVLGATVLIFLRSVALPEQTTTPAVQENPSASTQVL